MFNVMMCQFIKNSQKGLGFTISLSKLREIDGAMYHLA